MRNSKVGMKVGRLTVQSEFPEGKYYRAVCLCDCGVITTIHSHSLGKQVSCGCYAKEAIRNRARTHGESDSRMYKRYTGIKQRCENHRHKAFTNYGGRGIKNRWISFEAFKLDMAGTYFEGAELDRIDNDGDYCKKNCRWVTHSQNNRNKRNNVMYEGMCVTEWCERLGLNQSTVFVRIFRGKTIKEALGL